MSFVKRLKEALISPEDMGNVTLNQFFDERVYPHILVKKKYPEHDRLTYDKHIRPKLGTVKLGDISRIMVDDWMAAQIALGYKRSTVNKHVFLLNRIIKLASHWGFIAHSQYSQLLLERLSLGDYKQHFLSQGELRRLLHACDSDPHPYLGHFVRLLALTGARNGEARQAKWADIDLERGVWIVPKSKNGRSRRIVLSHAAREVLDRTCETAREIGTGIAEDDFVFTNPKTKTCYDSFYAAWHRARDAADLDTVRIHDLRHTFASLLINNGSTIYDVQKLLGHHHISMTERYAHLLPDRLHGEVEKVSNFL